MSRPTKALFVSTILSLILAAGASPTHAGIFEMVIDDDAKVTGNLTQKISINQRLVETDAVFNAATIQGPVKTRNVTQGLSFRVIRASGRSQQNYGVIQGNK